MRRLLLVLLILSTSAADAQVRIRLRTALDPVEAPASANIVPTGIGTVAQWSAGGAATVWEAVDEGSADGDTTYAVKTDSNGYHCFTYAGPSVPAGSTVNSVSVTTTHRNVGSTYWFLVRYIRVGGVDRPSVTTTIQAAATSYVTTTHAWTTNPKTLVAWTVDDVNGVGGNALSEFCAGATAMQAGDEARFTQIYLTIDYTEGSGGNPDPTPAIPDVPTTPGPASGATGVAVELALMSCVSTGGTSIDIQIDTVNPPLTTYAVGAACSFTPPIDFDYSTQYFWRARACSATGCSAYSSVWNFTTEADPGGPPPDPGNADHPVILIDATWEARWTAMKADYDADATCSSYTDDGEELGCRYYKHAIDRSAVGTSGYNNYGLFDAYLANTPGNDGPFYCGLAWDAVNSLNAVTSSMESIPPQRFLDRPASKLIGNYSRNFFVDLVLLHDLCYQDWSQSRRDTFLAKLNFMATTVVNTATYWRGGDVDQPIGDYFGLALLYESTKSYNPTIVSLWSTAKIGGYTATAANYGNARNMIKYYYTVAAAGGAGHEGSEYAFDSMAIGLVGNLLLKTTAAGSVFSEIDDWADDVARYLVKLPTPDGLEMPENGDDETPRQFVVRLDKEWMHLAVPAVASLADASTDRRDLQRKLIDLNTQHGHINLFWADILGVADPYATASADLTSLTKDFYASGYGIVMWNDALTSTAAKFWAHFRPEMRAIDHSVDYWGDFQLYRRGEWVLTAPKAYSGPGNKLHGQTSQADMVNGIFIEGFSGFPTASVQNGSPFQFRRIVGQVFGSDYAYVSGTQGGMRHPALNIDGGGNFFDPPPSYVHEHTRSVLYLPTADKTADSILVIDRVNAVDPESLTKFERYRPVGSLPPYTDCSAPSSCEPEKFQVQAYPRWTAFLHQRTNPTIASNVTTWTTAGGQLMRDVWLAPDDVTIAEVDESALAHYNASAAEKKWRTDVTPNVAAQWNCLSRVVTARNAATSAPTENELTPTNNAAGLHLVRSGNDDRVVVWNCAQGASISQSFPTQAQATTVLQDARWRAAGSYTFSYTQTTATAKVLLLDLDPDLTWTYTVNGGASTPITEDSSGLEELSISTAEAKTIVVTGT